jgi:hypothetical protein
MDSVRQFAGDQHENVKYHHEDDDYLLEKDETSTLYEVFLEQ